MRNNKFGRCRSSMRILDFCVRRDIVIVGLGWDVPHMTASIMKAPIMKRSASRVNSVGLIPSLRSL